MNAVARSTLLLITLLTAMPPGWCCAAFRLIPHASAESAPAPAACCCCCPDPTPDVPDQPAPMPTPSWCCQREPATPTKAEPADASPAPSLLDTVPAFAPAVTVCDLAPPAARIANPPPRVLHCLWLC